MKKLYLSVILIFTTLYASGQQLVPPIHNHSSVTYDGASQNWAIAIDERGVIYAANNQGLLSFDGQHWELFHLKNRAVIRSVLPHEDRIYTGSYQEFGYWKRDSKGEMQYTSLMSLLNKSLESEEFWEIISHKNAIYFRSFGAIYEYKNDEIRVVRKVGVNKMVIYNDRLLIPIPKIGLHYLNPDGSIDPLKNQEILKGKKVLDIEVDGSELLIGTKDKLFKFDGETCFLYPNSQLNHELAEFEFNHIMRIGENDLLLATVRNGILHHDIETGRTKTYNRENGLQNNTVLGMAFREGKLWLALDDGIDEVDLAFPVRFFTDHTGELGAVYDLAFHDGALFAASNTGVYSINNPGILMMEGGQGHTWNLEIINRKLYANHNSGTFKIENQQVTPIDTRTGSFQITKSPFHNKYFIGTYTGISIYDPSENSLLPLPGVKFPVKRLLFEDSSTVWAEHANKGIYRIGLTKDLTNTTFLQQIGYDEIDYRANVFKIDGQICVLKNRDWYRYNKLMDTLEVFEGLREFENHELLLEDVDGYWFSNRTNSSVVFTNFKNDKIRISFEELNKRPVKGNEAMVKAGDSIYYLTLKDGFARIDLQGLIQYRKNQSFQKPFFKAFQDEDFRYDLSSSPSLPYKSSRVITIRAGHPGSNASLYYELEGNQSMKGKIKNGNFTFQNLPHGDYLVNLFAMDPQGKNSEITSMSFTVEAPWYLSTFSKTLYVLGFLLIALVIYLLNKRKLQKHRHFLEQKLQKEHKERLERLEKKRLEDEIMMKRKELANTTLMAAKKNEVLMDIQGELNKDRDKFTNQYRLKHIMNKINKAIKNKDEWQVFETNFKEVHEDFSKDLLREFPKLTVKDLKLCSYLKMNLTSKEIAPLMGKSVRGVEVHRYRLRKKMDLDSQENLSAFLIKNF